MNNKTTALTLLSILLLIAYIPMAFAHNEPFPGDYDSTHFVIDTIGDPETMDPAWAYDTASGEVINQVYNTLIFYDVNWDEGAHAGVNGITNPLDPNYKSGAGATNAFTPVVASAMATIDYTTSEINPITGEPYYSTWYFPIRTGMEFHTWEAYNETVYADLVLTPEDVEYSFERVMIQDRDGGPQWMFFEPLLQEYYADPGPDGGVKINRAVESNETMVWFNLVAAYPELAFNQILTQSWSSIVCKAWAKDRGDFDGDWSRSWTDIYTDWHNPEVSFLDSPEPGMVGTGPYTFSYWTSGESYSVERYADYWDGFPARASASGGPDGNLPLRLGGYVEKVTWRELASWTVRRGNLLAGTSDESVVPRPYRDQVLGQIVGGEKIRNFWPVGPILSCNGFYMTFDIAGTSNYMGVHKPEGTFGTDGIPPDLFSDFNVRKGFALAFDYNTFLSLAYLGEGSVPADPIVPGLAYDNPANNKYAYKLGKTTNPTAPPVPYSSEYYLKLAWGGSDPNNDGIVAAGDEGDLWTGGMKFQVVYNIGNFVRELAAIEISQEVNSLNPSKFFLETLGQDWGTQLLPAMVARELPMFHIGWLADYADPHNFAFPFQHTYGTFTHYQGYSNPVVDALCEAGIAIPDDAGWEDANDANYTANGKPLDVGDPRTVMDNWREETDPQAYIDNPPDSHWPRRSVYYALQALWYEDIPTIMYLQGKGRHFEQVWTKGWYFNPLYPGGYYMHRWKALTHFGDVSTYGVLPTDTLYGRQDGAIDTGDSGFVSAHWSNPLSSYGYHPTADISGGVGATSGGLSGPVRGMPDGKVDIVDLGVISAYWDNPAGPSHPT